VRRAALEQALRDGGQVVRGGGPYDRYDLEVRAGALGRARVRLAVEEHGQGRQLVRARVWPHVSLLGLLIACACAAAATVAAGDAAWLATVVLAAAGLAFALWTLRDAGAAVGALLGELRPPRVRAAAPREHVVAELHPLPAGEEL